MSKPKPVPVVFRVDNEGVFALFPTAPADYEGLFCTVYQEQQHSSADYTACIHSSRPAKPKEYTDLKAELERRGYVLQVVQRRTSKMREEFWADLQAIKGRIHT